MANGCKHRQGMSPGYWSPQRCYFPDGRFEVRPQWIPHKMSTECRNFLAWDSEACEGCRAPKDLEYAKERGYKAP